MSLLGVTYDIKELAVLARTAGDKSFLYRTICKDYVNSINAVEIIELLNDMEWNNMTSRDLKMLNLLRLLYREEEFFQSDKLFESEVDIYRFKTDCARILSVFPDKEVLFEFDKNCVNDQYKLLVYSYIFNVMYDEDMYHKYEYSYENLSVDAGLYYTYMRFVATVFEAQLEWNRDYPFFYKKWRYLKLYLAAVLYADSIVDDHKILEVMEQNGHYDSIYSEGYRPFIENVNRFWNSEGISQADKKCILYSLMMGRMGDFIQMKGGEIRSYSQDDKLLLKEIISQLDYREVNLVFNRNYLVYKAAWWTLAMRVIWGIPYSIGVLPLPIALPFAGRIGFYMDTIALGLLIWSVIESKCIDESFYADKRVSDIFEGAEIKLMDWDEDNVFKIVLTCAEEATVICFAEEYKEHNVMVLRPIDLDETCVLIVEKSADTDLWHDVEDDTVRSEILQKYMENNRPDCMEVVE